MVPLAFGALIIGAFCIVLATAPALPQPTPDQEPSLRDALLGRLREVERRADRLPVIGPSLTTSRRRQVHAQVRDRLPGFWGDVVIYLKEGQRQLPGAIAAAIDRLNDPLSQALRTQMKKVQLGGSIEVALRAAAEELSYEPFSDGIDDLLATQELGGDMIQVAEELRDQATDDMVFEREEATATLEIRMMVMLWPLLFLALMLAIFVPIVVSGLGTLLGL